MKTYLRLLNIKVQNILKYLSDLLKKYLRSSIPVSSQFQLNKKQIL